jgi:selenide,water dikinase
MEEDVKLTKLSKCAGCGAKVGAGVLAKLLSDLPTLHDEHLLVGFDKSDDAAVYKISDERAIVQTLDFFPPIADDPYTFGQIAATNALSDIYAMGGEPKLALNIMCVPKSMDSRSVHEILRGGYEKCAEAGAIICGGHSIFDDEPKYGLSVTGFVHPDHVWKNHGAKPGDVLFLTKPIGIGVLTAAQRGDLLDESTKEFMIRLMTTLNKSARDVLSEFTVHACTDVTGFSFLGHLYEMCSGSQVTAEINTDAISLIPEALEFARIGILPEGMYRNRSFAEHAVDSSRIELAICDLLFDPQTSGGLLAAVPAAEADAVYQALTGNVPCVQRVGTIVERKEKSIYLF